MYFNSIAYAIFLPIVFIVYWLIQYRTVKIQNAFILFSSYVFYGWWDPRFLSLILISSVTDYIIGIKLENEIESPKRKLLLLISVSVNIGLLFIFKYFGFFVNSFAQLLSRAGIEPNIPSLNIILPVGISFYTFQTLSYTIDIYRRQIKPTRDPLAFFAFVAFFPQLVAGPIERAKHLLPQFKCERKFNLSHAKDGLRQILWGLFKKTVIADNLSVFVELAFEGYHDLSGLDIVIGSSCFAVQIYCDFSGYSDIAIGSARLVGFNLRRNFNNPYFARSLSEFWQRWHISLSTWFRDYVYIPLGGNRVGRLRWIGIVLITFGVSGLWHGANWTFIAWGLIHGTLYFTFRLIPGFYGHSNVVAEETGIPSLRELCQITITFTFVTFAWIFFRAQTMSQATGMLNRLVDGRWDIVSLPTRQFVLSSILLFGIEWVNRKRAHGLDIAYLPLWVRWFIYYMIIALILTYGVSNNVPFIYFQF